MEAECANFEISRMSRLLKVSRSGYYRWLAHRDIPSARQVRRNCLASKITAIHSSSKGTSGALRITAELAGTKDAASHNTVASVMGELGIQGISPRTFKVKTTISTKDANYPLIWSLVALTREDSMQSGHRISPIWPLERDSVTFVQSARSILAGYFATRSRPPWKPKSYLRP